jgi:hypothetical protein
MKRGWLGAACLVCALGGAAQETKPYDPYTVTKEAVKERLDKMPPAHPRLFVKRADAFAKIRAAIDQKPEWKMIRDWIVRDADEVLKKEPARRVQQGMRMQGQHEVEKRVGLLAAAYRLTEKPVYAERAKAELLAAAAFADWNPSHFLDTAEMTLGVALGYDWLYDALDEATRKTLCEALREKGLKQALAKKYFWTKGNNNWSQVCWAGMVAGALAIRDQEPELALEIIHQAVTSVPYSIKPYEPNGSYPEGPGYWTYGTTYYVYLMELLRKALDTDFGLYDLPGFAKTGDYINIVTGPSGRFYNYADGGDGRGHQLALWWLALRAGRPDWLRKEVADVRESLRLNDPGKTGLRSVSFPVLLLFWFQETEADAKIAMPLNWASEGHVPIIVMRSSWEDPNAAFLATKGGPAVQNHGHMDSGSFVYESDGVRWAVDLGSQSYYTIEKLGMSLWSSAQNSDRWKIFRLSSASHNVVTIDGQLHVAKGFGKIVTFDADAHLPHAVIDLSEVYAGQAQRVTRACALLPSRTGAIQDRLAGVKPGAKVRWAMVTHAKSCAAQGSDMLLKDGAKSLTVRAAAPAAVTWQVTDLATPPNSWDVANKGASMILFEVEAPADGALDFRVLLVPGGVQPEQAVPDFLRDVK